MVDLNGNRTIEFSYLAHCATYYNLVKALIDVLHVYIQQCVAIKIDFHLHRAKAEIADLYIVGTSFKVFDSKYSAGICTLNRRIIFFVGCDFNDCLG